MLEDYWNPGKNSPSVAQPADNQPPPPSTNVPTPVNYPTQNTNGVYYAGFLIRFMAFFVDGIVIAIIGILLSMVAFTISSILALDLVNLLKDFGWTLQIIIVLIVYLYNILLINFFGQTIGKKVAGLKVLKEDFTKPTIVSVLLRELLGRIISNVIIISYFVIPFNSKKKAVHDFIAGTVVIRNAPPKKHEGCLLGGCLIFVFLLPIVGILAVGLLSALNPIQMVSKSKDTATRNFISEFQGAVERYKAIKNSYPWTGTISGTTLSDYKMTAAIDKMIQNGDLKRDTINRNKDSLYLIYISSEGNKTSICFEPQSVSFHDAAKFDLLGHENPTCPTRKDCFLCQTF